jgi:hypothetical protein
MGIPRSSDHEEAAMQFAFLLYGDEAAEAAMPADDLRAIVREHGAFGRKLREDGRLRFGEALGASSTAVLVRPGRRGFTDGPYAETKEQLGGMYVVECADRDEAIELARQIPDSPGLVVEVRPIT